MCGICGFIDPSGNTTGDALLSVVGSMASRLAHRGPDEEGTWSDPEAGLALGHRRLSIIDLTPTGRQPMESFCGRYVIVLNGEIYNFMNIRAELEREGVPFRGRSDTEVVLAAISIWGVRRALERMVGMFAFALWDKRERTLTLARDRMGRSRSTTPSWGRPSLRLRTESDEGPPVLARSIDRGLSPSSSGTTTFRHPGPSTKGLQAPSRDGADGRRGELARSAPSRTAGVLVAPQSDGRGIAAPSRRTRRRSSFDESCFWTR